MRTVVVPATGWQLPARDVVREVASKWNEGAPSDVVSEVLLSDGRGGFTDLPARGGPHEDRFVDIARFGPRVDAPGGPAIGSSYALGLELARVVRERPGRDGRVILGSSPQETVGWADGGAGLLAGLMEGMEGLAVHGAAPGSDGDHSAPLPVIAPDVLLRGALRLGDAAVDDLPDLNAIRRTLLPHRLVLASRTSGPLLGLDGLAASLNAAGVLDDASAHATERALGDFAHIVARKLGSDPVGRSLLAEPKPGTSTTTSIRSPNADASARARELTSLARTGAAGGIGFILTVLGAQLVDALEFSAQRADLDGALDASDLVVVVAPVLDADEMHDGVTRLVAARALERALPVVVITGESHAGRREWSALGISAVYESGTETGLASLLARTPGIARTWSR